MKRPSIELTLDVDRDHKVLLERLVEGLIGGGLAGPGLAIESRDGRAVRFRRRLSAWHRIPDSGEIEVEATAGSTQVTCRLDCAGLRLRRLVISVGLGATLASVTALAFGWLIVVSVPVACIASALADIVGWRRERAQLRRRVETYITNTNYLTR